MKGKNWPYMVLMLIILAGVVVLWVVVDRDYKKAGETVNPPTTSPTAVTPAPRSMLPPTAVAVPAPPTTEPVPQPQIVEPAQATPVSNPSRPAVNQVGSISKLIGIRCNRHDENGGFDRIVFDFNGPVPNRVIEYVDEVTADGSGNVTNPPYGSHYLNIIFTPADAHQDNGASSVTLTCPGVSGLPVLASYVLHSDYEAHVGLALGLNKSVAYRTGQVDRPVTADGKKPKGFYIDLPH